MQHSFCLVMIFFFWFNMFHHVMILSFGIIYWYNLYALHFFFKISSFLFKCWWHFGLNPKLWFHEFVVIFWECRNNSSIFVLPLLPVSLLSNRKSVYYSSFCLVLLVIAPQSLFDFFFPTSCSSLPSFQSNYFYISGNWEDSVILVT